MLPRVLMYGAEHQSFSTTRSSQFDFQQFRQWRDSREQAHLSAEQPPPGEDPWFPLADADPRRPSHPGRASA